MVIHNSNNFRTELHPVAAKDKIDHRSNVFTIGSCFSDCIGNRLQDNKFNVLVNPAGTVYNPISIFRLLESEGLDNTKFVKVGDQYFHHDFHSSFTARDQNTLGTVLELKIKEIKEGLKEANYLFITLGTVYVYELHESKSVVSNCHKVPQKNFSKRMLSIQELRTSFDQLRSYMDAINPKLKFIFTVSPVRHIKDGIAENQLSKSMLRVFCGELAEEGLVEYFPAYELMMDDLRDYRFYKTDMIHPTEMAEDYIWEFFQQTFFTDSTQKILKEWGKMKAALAHKPFNPDSGDHQRFIKNQLDKLKVFEEYFDIQNERALFEDQLI